MTVAGDVPRGTWRAEYTPWASVFPPSRRWFVVERDGKGRVVIAYTLIEEKLRAYQPKAGLDRAAATRIAAALNEAKP